MWSDHFLDFTILEISEERVENDCLLRDCYRSSTKLYDFNPFNGVYTEQEYTKRTKLFPNKLLDLNGFEIKVGSFHFPPSVYVRRNSTGYPVEVTGSDALFAEILSKKMNFRVTEVLSQEEWYGNWHCDNEKKRTGLAYLLGNNTIQFITNLGGIAPHCAGQSLFSTGIRPIPICVLIAVPSFEISPISPTPKWMYMVLMVFITRIITILLKFDNNVWPWFDILRASLGMTVPREPSRLSERIVFISIVVAFSIFSSNIFAILTDTRLAKKSEMDIESLKDLNMTNLIPTTIASTVYLMRNMNDPVLQALANKSNIVSQYEECVDMLIQGKNVACILKETTALKAIREYEGKDPVMKMMNERVFFANRAINLEPKSPYVRQIDAIIRSLLESGLQNHWEGQFSTPERKSHHRETEEEPDSVSIFIPLVFFITSGCSFSMIAFLCELLLKYIDNRFQKCATLFAQENGF